MERARIELPRDIVEGLHRVARAHNQATTSYVQRQLIHVLAQTDTDRQRYWLTRAAALNTRKPRTPRQPQLPST